MIFIDKSKAEHNIVFSTTLTVADASTFSLELISDSARTQHEFTLVDNLSTDNNRFIYFILSHEVFTDLPSGYYTYSIKDIEENVLSIGKCYVKDIETSEFIMPESDSTNEEFIVYNG